MEIKTKFNHGDMVFYMKHNKILSNEITKITVVGFREPNVNGYTEYYCHGEFTLKEQDVFATKQKLLDSL